MGSIVGDITDAIGLTDISGTEARGKKAAEQQRQAALQSAQLAAFRPVGITNTFGTSDFGYTDVNGVPRVTSASYTISPELKAIQNALFQLTGGNVANAQQALQQAQPLGEAARSLFNLGAGYLNESPEASRQRIYNELQAARLPSQIQEEQRLASSVFGRGRAGLNVSGMGQPELYSLARAREAQRAADISAANQQAQQMTQFGTGLFGTGAQLLGSQYAIPTQALGPLQSLLGTVGTIEELGQQPFRLGLAVGGASQPGASAGSQLLQSGMNQAALTQQAAAQAASNQLTGFMNKALGAAVGAFGMPSGGLGGAGASSGYGLGATGYGIGYGINPLGQQAQMLAAQW